MSITEVVPYLHVASVAASMKFYGLLGMDVSSTHGPAENPFWARMIIGPYSLMLAQASGPIDSGQQAAMLYMYSNDLEAVRAKLLDSGCKDGTQGQSGKNEVFAVTHPFYMELGELRVHDPDGYVLLIGKIG